MTHVNDKIKNCSPELLAIAAIAVNFNLTLHSGDVKEIASAIESLKANIKSGEDELRKLEEKFKDPNQINDALNQKKLAEINSIVAVCSILSAILGI